MRPVPVRADVDQQVAAIGYDVDQQVDQLGAGQGVGGGFPGVVPEGAAQAAAQLPGPAGCGVGDGVLVGLDVVVEVRPRPGQFPSQPRRRLQRQDDVPQVQSADDGVAWHPDLVHRSLTTPSATVS